MKRSHTGKLILNVNVILSKQSCNGEIKENVCTVYLAVQVYVCACVRVDERERERQRQKETEWEQERERKRTWRVYRFFDGTAGKFKAKNVKRTHLNTHGHRHIF